MSSLAELLDKIAEVPQEVERTKRENEENGTSQQELAEQISDLTKLNSELIAKNRKLSTENSSLKKKNSWLKDIECKYWNVADRLEEAETRISRLTTSHARLTTEQNLSLEREKMQRIELEIKNTKIRATLTAECKRLTDMATADGSLDLANRLKAAEKHNKELSASINSMKSIHQQLKNDKERLAEREEETRLKNQTKERQLQDKISELTSQVAALKKTSSTLTKQCQRLKTMTTDDRSVDELIDQCNCTVCYNTYDSVLCVPRLLDCGHTFCGTCIKKVTDEGQAKCPACNEISYLLADRTLPINYFAISVAEQTLKTNFQKKGKCEVCKKTLGKSTGKIEGNLGEGDNCSADIQGMETDNEPAERAIHNT